jgi:hypothetical protein
MGEEPGILRAELRPLFRYVGSAQDKDELRCRLAQRASSDSPVAS